jgi:hypothetical protein
MTIGLALGALVSSVLLLFIAFIFGYFRGREKEQKEHDKEALLRAESDKAFEQQKEKIRADAYADAEGKKAALSSGSGRGRFDVITDSLRSKN